MLVQVYRFIVTTYEFAITTYIYIRNKVKQENIFNRSLGKCYTTLMEGLGTFVLPEIYQGNYFMYIKKISHVDL